MSARELSRALASGDEQTARRAIRACGERLREGRGDDHAEVVAALTPLAQHASAIVRQALADACDAFPDEAFDATHALLLADRDVYVARAAEAAGHKHAQQRGQRAKVSADDHDTDDILAEIDRRFGRAGRKLAERFAERRVEHFAQMLDHETRKTKNAIYLALMQLTAEIERPERSIGLLKEQLATLRERSAFVFAIVNRASVYATRAKPVFAEESLAKLVDEARAQLVSRIGKRAATMAFTSDVDPETRAEVDRHALLQALQNVLQNAVEAYDEAAATMPVRVSATVARGASEVALTVADEGVGILTERIPEIFIPFGSRKPGGTGVGLLIVRRVVKEIHGGTLDIKSAPGKGTTVTMTFPAKQRA